MKVAAIISQGLVAGLAVMFFFIKLPALASVAVIGSVFTIMVLMRSFRPGGIILAIVVNAALLLLYVVVFAIAFSLGAWFQNLPLRFVLVGIIVCLSYCLSILALRRQWVATRAGRNHAA